MMFDPKSAKPIPIEARFVSSTGRRAATRRSSSGSAARNWYHPQTSRTAMPPNPQPRVGALVQPHSLPREIASRMPVSPTASPRAPM